MRIFLFAAIAVFAMRGVPAAAQVAEKAPLGLTYCSPPQPPACAELDESFARQTALDACNAAFRRYISSVLTYRACINRELTRVVTEANAASDRFSCRYAGRRNCK